MGIYSKTRDYFRKLIYLNKLQKQYGTTFPELTKKTPLDFVQHSAPLVSIIIPFYNQYEYTLNCLYSIAENLPEVSFEIILIDDKSSENCDFSFVNNITILRNEENLGFLRSVNKGVSFAKGNYIYLLNNDTKVHQGFLDELLLVYRNFDNVGAVGSMLLNMDGTLQEAGSFFLHDHTPTQIANKKIYAPEINYVYRVDYCSGCSLLFKKTNDDGVLNLFDEQFAPAYFEDADLCFHLRHSQGKEIYYTPFSKVTHYNGVSYNSKEKTDNTKEELFTKNHNIFRTKWGTILNNISAKSKWERMEELYGDKHIVFFHVRPPQFDNNSGELRLTEIIKTYLKLGYNTSLIAPKNRIKDRYNAYFQRLGVRVYYAYTPIADLTFFMRRFVKDNPLVWFSASDMFVKYYAFARKHFPYSKTIFDMVDVHHLRYQRALEVSPNNKKYKRRYKRYYKYEKRAANQCDIVVAISDDEMEYMTQFSPEAKLLVISNIHYVKVHQKDTPSFEERTGLLFIGSTHHPNIDAIHFLKDEILPEVWKSHPDIELHIVGDVKNVFKDVNHPKIKFHGYIPDITTLFMNHRIMVAPLRYGAGVKGKIGQAFEYFLPVVTSSTGAEGMFLKHEKNALLADNGKDFAQQIIKLYNDKDTWLKLQNNSEDSLLPFSIQTLIEKLKVIEDL